MKISKTDYQLNNYKQNNQNKHTAFKGIYYILVKKSQIPKELSSPSDIYDAMNKFVNMRLAKTNLLNSFLERFNIQRKKATVFLEYPEYPNIVELLKEKGGASIDWLCKNITRRFNAELHLPESDKDYHKFMILTKSDRTIYQKGLPAVKKEVRDNLKNLPEDYIYEIDDFDKKAFETIFSCMSKQDLMDRNFAGKPANFFQLDEIRALPQVVDLIKETDALSLSKR